MAILAAYVGGLCKHDLVRGETGVVLLIAPDQRQAKIALDYCAAALEQSPILKQLVESRSADALQLTNGISIEVRAASFRRLRGPTYVAVIADESYWSAARRYGRSLLARSRRKCLWSATSVPQRPTRANPWRLHSDAAYKKPAISWARTLRSNTAGRSNKLIDCPRWRRIWLNVR
jgi:hypothetical protein